MSPQLPPPPTAALPGRRAPGGEQKCGRRTPPENDQEPSSGPQHSPDSGKFSQRGMCGGEGAFLREHLHKLAFQMGVLLMQDLAGAEPLLGGLRVLGHSVKVPAHTLAPSRPQRSWLASLRRAEEEELAPTLPASAGVPGKRDSCPAQLPGLSGKGVSLCPLPCLWDRAQPGPQEGADPAWGTS